MGWYRDPDTETPVNPVAADSSFVTTNDDTDNAGVVAECVMVIAEQPVDSTSCQSPCQSPCQSSYRSFGSSDTQQVPSKMTKMTKKPTNRRRPRKTPAESAQSRLESVDGDRVNAKDTKNVHHTPDPDVHHTPDPDVHHTPDPDVHHTPDPDVHHTPDLDEALKTMPKRPLTPFFEFMNDKRDEICKKFSNKGIYTPVDVSKKAGSLWKKSTKTQREYNMRYEKDMARYNQVYLEWCEEYPDVVAFLKKKKADERLEKKKRQNRKMERMERRKNHDPDAPRRPLGPYIIFGQDWRKDYMDKLHNKTAKEIPSKEIMRVIGEEWRNMSEGKKEVYKVRAQEDKERYNREMEAYKGKNT